MPFPDPLFQTIRSTFGGRCVVILQTVAKEERLLIRLQSALQFLKKCLTGGMLPRSLWFRLPGRHDMDSSLRRTIAKRILRKEIEWKKKEISSLTSTLHIRRDCLLTILGDSPVSERVSGFLEQRSASFFEETLDRFRRRFERLEYLQDQTP